MRIKLSIIKTPIQSVKVFSWPHSNPKGWWNCGYNRLGLKWKGISLAIFGKAIVLTFITKA